MDGPFRNRQFRRLFAGRVVTNVGDSLYFIAAMWLVYDLTGDPLYSGIAGFLTLAPSTLQFLAGPFVDRWSIRRTLTGTQAVQAVVVSLVPVAHAAGALTAELVLVVMPALSALNQLVYPAQTAALPRILDDEDLVAANSAFSIAYQGMDMVANGVGGVLIGVFGAVTLFAIDAATFGIAALLFATLSIPTAGAPSNEAEAPERSRAGAGGTAADGGAIEADAEEGYLDRLRGGANLLRGTFLLWLIGGAAIVNFTAGMALAALPVYADGLAVPPALDALGDAGAYGVLMAAFAGGNFLGAIGANAVADRRFGATMIVGLVLSAVLWIGAIAVSWLPATAALLVLSLLPVGIINVQIAAVIQSAPPEEYVGRVSSMLGSASSATIPFGSLVGGAVAGAIGPRIAMLGLGFGSLVFAAYVLAIPQLRGLAAPDEVTLDADEAT